MLIKNICKKMKNSEKNKNMIRGIHYFSTELKTKMYVIPRSCFKSRCFPLVKWVNLQCSFIDVSDATLPFVTFSPLWLCGGKVKGNLGLVFCQNQPFPNLARIHAGHAFVWGCVFVRLLVTTRECWYDYYHYVNMVKVIITNGWRRRLVVNFNL